MAMTKPKSSQIEHRGESVQKVIDDLTQQDGVLDANPSWEDVPKLKGVGANAQAQALVNRTEFVVNELEKPSGNKPIGGFADYEAMRAYSGQATLAWVTHHLYGGLFEKRAGLSATDNGGTIIVDADGNRWVRKDWEDGVWVHWFGAVGDYDPATGVGTDDTAAINKARSVSKHIKFKKTSKGYLYKQSVELVSETWEGSGVGRIWGNTAPVIYFGGFAAEWAIISKTKTNILRSLLIRPTSWDSETGFLGGGVRIQGVLNCYDCGIFGFKTNNVRAHDTGFETWLSTFYNTWTGYSGQDSILTSANALALYGCSGNWAGATSFLANPTVAADFSGLKIIHIELGSPGGIILIGGDWSYNAGYGIWANGGTGHKLEPGYMELNLKNGIYVGELGTGLDINAGHVGQGVTYGVLPSPFVTPHIDTLARRPHTIKIAGVSHGGGWTYGDDATEVPKKPLSTCGNEHQLFTNNWSGVFGGILKIMTKTGNLIWKGVSGDDRTMLMRFDKVKMQDARTEPHNIVTRACITTTVLPDPSYEVSYTWYFLENDHTKMYICVWQAGASWVWRKVDLTSIA